MARRPNAPAAPVAPDFPPMLYVRMNTDPDTDAPVFATETTVEALMVQERQVIGYYQWVRTVDAHRYVQVSTLPPPPAAEILAQAKRDAIAIVEQARSKAKRVAAERRQRARERRLAAEERRAREQAERDGNLVPLDRPAVDRA